MSGWPARRWRVVAAASAVAVLAGIVGWVASPWGRSAAGPSEPVVLATGVPGGVSHRYGVALAESAGHLNGVISTVVTEGSRENLDLLVRGEATFALATADVVEAYLATEPGAESIRAVARLYESYVHLVVAADGPVHRLADLRGRRVAIGPPNSGTPLVADRILAALGIDPTTDVTWLEMGPREAIASLNARRGDGAGGGPDSGIDAFIMVDGTPSPDLGRLTGGRLIDLADAADALLGYRACPAAACAVYHGGTVPAGTYSGLAVAITTVAVPTLLLTTTRVGADVVGQLTELVFDSAPGIAVNVPAVRQIDRHAAIFTGPVPLHDGARAYYRGTKVAA